jgi:hypothetical protein
MGNIVVLASSEWSAVLSGDRVWVGECRVTAVAWDVTASEGGRGADNISGCTQRTYARIS